MLDTIEINEGGHAYLFRMDSHQVGHKHPEREYIVVVNDGKSIHYDALALTHSPGYNEVRLRAFRSVNVPEAKREYLWTEFYRKLPKEERDTTHANWFGYVHTFHSQDQPAFRPINNYVSINSPCLSEENGDPSIPVRDMKIVDGETVETSQVAVRLPRPGIAVVTHQSGSLTKGQKSWLGTYALHSSFASDPMATVKDILTDTSGCETTSEEEKR